MAQIQKLHVDRFGVITKAIKDGPGNYLGTDSRGRKHWRKNAQGGGGKSGSESGGASGGDSGNGKGDAAGGKLRRSAALLDRFVGEDGGGILRVQHRRTGETFDVHVPDTDVAVELAGRYSGGASVPYVVRNGRAELYVEPGAMSTKEMMDFDRQDEIRAARRHAGDDAPIEEIERILDTPMSQNQRRAALQALAGKGDKD